MWHCTGSGPTQPAVRRCYFHIYTAVRRHLSQSPRLEADQELMSLTRALMGIPGLDQAAAWMGLYASCEAKRGTLRQRSYPRAGIPRPTGAKHT